MNINLQRSISVSFAHRILQGRKDFCLIFALLLLFSAILHSQPIIDNDMLPKMGDTLFIANDNLPEGIKIFPIKGEQEWNFMKLQSAFSKKTAIQGIRTPLPNTIFHRANFFTEDISGIKEFFHLGENTIQLVGSEGLDPYGLGVQARTIYEPNFTILKTPIEYGTSRRSHTHFTTTLLANQLPITILYSLPILPDSIRLVSTVDMNQEIDAWGHLVLPDNSFEVLREKRNTTTQTRLEIKVGLFPWRDITDDIYTAFFPKETKHLSYHFYSNETVMPVLIANMKENGIQAENITYLVSDPNIVTNNPNAESDVYAYPNPAIDEVRFEFSNLPTDQYKLKIFNILGLILLEEEYQLSGFETIKWDISTLRKGTYLYSLENKEGKTIATRRLIVIRP